MQEARECSARVRVQGGTYTRTTKQNPVERAGAERVYGAKVGERGKARGETAVKHIEHIKHAEKGKTEG